MAWIFGGRRQSDGQRNQPNPPVAVSNGASNRPPPPPYRQPVPQAQPVVQVQQVVPRAVDARANHPEAAPPSMNRAQSTMKRLKYPALDRIEVVSSSSSSQRRLDLRALVQELSMIDSDVLVAATPSPKLDLKIERMILSEAEASVINRSRDLNEERERQQKLVKEHLRRVEEQRREDQLREQMRREQEQREMENIQTSQPVTDALVDVNSSTSASSLLFSFSHSAASLILFAMLTFSYLSSCFLLLFPLCLCLPSQQTLSSSSSHRQHDDDKHGRGRRKTKTFLCLTSPWLTALRFPLFLASIHLLPLPPLPTTTNPRFLVSSHLFTSP
eukprot:767679-Hanusia_phi.AAC.1